MYIHIHIHDIFSITNFSSQCELKSIILYLRLKYLFSKVQNNRERIIYFANLMWKRPFEKLCTTYSEVSMPLNLKLRECMSFRNRSLLYKYRGHLFIIILWYRHVAYSNLRCFIFNHPIIIIIIIKVFIAYLYIIHNGRDSDYWADCSISVLSPNLKEIPSCLRISDIDNIVDKNF